MAWRGVFYCSITLPSAVRRKSVLRRWNLRKIMCVSDKLFVPCNKTLWEWKYVQVNVTWWFCKVYTNNFSQIVLRGLKTTPPEACHICSFCFVKHGKHFSEFFNLHWKAPKTYTTTNVTWNKRYTLPKTASHKPNVHKRKTTLRSKNAKIYMFGRNFTLSPMAIFSFMAVKQKINSVRFNKSETHQFHEGKTKENW